MKIQVGNSGNKQVNSDSEKKVKAGSDSPQIFVQKIRVILADGVQTAAYTAAI